MRLLLLAGHEGAVILLHGMAHGLLIQRLSKICYRRLLHLAIPRHGGRDLRRGGAGAGILQAGDALEWRRSRAGEEMVRVGRRCLLWLVKGRVGRGMEREVGGGLFVGGALVCW